MEIPAQPWRISPKPSPDPGAPKTNVKLSLKAALFACVLSSLASLTPLQAQFLLTVNNSTGVLTKIDRQTLAITSIGSLGVGFSYGDLAWNPVSGTLYMVDGWGGNTSLYTVNISTGAATLVGSHGVSGLFGLAYDTQNNTLYAASASDTASMLYSLNPANGTATPIGSMLAGYWALAFNSQLNMLLGVNDGTGNIYQVNITTGGTTLLPSLGNTNNSGATYDSALNLLLDIGVDGYLYSYDIANNYARTTLLSTGGTGTGLTYDGLAYIAAVPEPASAALWMSGLALMGGLARKRISRRFGSDKILRER